MCTRPRKAFDTGYLTESGKPLYKITSFETEFIYKPKSQDVGLSQRPSDCYTDLKIWNYIEVPCGQCVECRLQGSKEWATRCMIEAEHWQCNEMLTLTYDNEHLPIVQGVDNTTGEIVERGTLNKKDVQDFLKRLRIEWQRKYGHDNIRFYMCGEYGEQYQRPHYHILLFNFPVPDKTQFLKENGQVIKSKDGYVQYTSRMIKKLWGKGNITLCPVNWETCSYVARYIMKKKKGKEAEEHYKKLGIEPEYTCMSRKPGIGQVIFEKMEKDYAHFKIYTKSKHGVIKTKTPRYYDKLYDKNNSEALKLIKENRKENQLEAQAMTMARTNIDKHDYNTVRENNLLAKLKQSTRNFEKGL